MVDPLDFSMVHTDLHSHLIPGVDDGSQNLKDSLNLAAALVDMGYKKIITTPHIMRDLYPNNRDIILSGYELLKSNLDKKGINVELEVAAEYYLDDHFDQLLAKKELLTFGDNYVLFELAFMQEPMQLKKSIFEMQMAGYKPVLAHPERYPYWHNKIDKYHELHENDVKLQMNINSLTGHYSPQVQKVAEKISEQGVVSFIGSDFHNMGQLHYLHQAGRLPSLHNLVKNIGVLNSNL